ncbi:hypothetical protein [Brevundimonas sp. SORGH_AS_0993]|uniref:hypothetical protein n=1 Tax=Brevundimonas sp. SORGH_AS_0993 TaxID=3041794 RepID=UPI00278A3EE3|nr:hypothetical protein [Brevundimonas sp. SORGH_AS_0993]MDQ1154764.1 hypothetical protein [Brevundimonas sp. SORGH_AS_0993]
MVNEMMPKPINGAILSSLPLCEGEGSYKHIGRTVWCGKLRFISLGGNCMVAGQLRRIFRPKTSYFDNLVTPFDGLIKALNRGCHKPLRAEDFEIGIWEGFPSAREIETGIYFHHEFKGGNPAATTNESFVRQDIDGVNEKFSYLAKRFLEVARSSDPKCYIRREYNGDSLDSVRMHEIRDALVDLGAQNFVLANAHQSEFYKGLIVHDDIRYIQVPKGDDDGWMGSDLNWNAAFLSLCVDLGLIR